MESYKIDTDTDKVENTSVKSGFVFKKLHNKNVQIYEK